MTAAPNKVVLSTSSVYPEKTVRAMELANLLCYDGVEVMIGIDPLASDLDQVAEMQQTHQVAITAIHAPTLLVTQGTWGRDPWDKLRRSGQAAARFGADVVVVHPPFSWQRAYGRKFVDGIAQLNEEFAPVQFCVENMYKWRTPFGRIQPYLPSWDPSDFAHEHLTLDLSHASTAQRSARQLAREWGPRLRHLHFTDGSGSFKDEHLFPGEGNQDAWALLDDLVGAGFEGQVVLEVNSRKAGGPIRRQAMLGQALMAIRDRLGQPIAPQTRAATAEALASHETGTDPRGALDDVTLGKDWRDGA